MIDHDEFVQIGPEFFLKGMYVDSDVFYIRNNIPVLFCKQSVITDEKIDKLTKIAKSKAPMFIAKSSYQLLMRQYGHFKSINEEMASKYESVKSEFLKQADQTRESGRIVLKESENLTDSIGETLSHVELLYILQWISYMRDSDQYLCTHSVNVAMLNGLLGNWMGLTPDDQKRLVLTGLLHDIGKTKIADAIINKPGKLTAEEFEVVKMHPLYSYEILKVSGVRDEDILSGVRGHHEKINGNGYPDKLNLSKISLFARITAIADIYDAMVAKRVYKKAQSPFEALDEFYKNKYSDLDIRLVDIFLDHMINEMYGKEVILSDGRIAKIMFMEKNKISFPVVQCGEEIINTGPSLKCESLCSNIGITRQFKEIGDL